MQKMSQTSKDSIFVDGCGIWMFIGCSGTRRYPGVVQALSPRSPKSLRHYMYSQDCDVH